MSGPRWPHQPFEQPDQAGRKWYGLPVFSPAAQPESGLCHYPVVRDVS